MGGQKEKVFLTRTKGRLLLRLLPNTKFIGQSKFEKVCGMTKLDLERFVFVKRKNERALAITKFIGHFFLRVLPSVQSPCQTP